MSKSKRSITQFTYDIEEFIDRLQELVNKKSYEEFANDELSIAFVERNLEKIGEAIGQIQKLDENILYLAYDNKGFWEKIKGMRNRLIHEYFGVSIEMIYYVSRDELDELKEYIIKVREFAKE